MAIAPIDLRTAQTTKLQPGQSIGVSSDQFAFPSLAEALAGGGASGAQQGTQGLLDLLRDPGAAPGYQSAVQGLIESRRPQVEQGYQDLSDAFRNAGALQSGAYGTALAKYAGEVDRSNVLAGSEVYSKILPSLLQGYSGLSEQTPSLLNALKQRQAFDLSQSGAGAGSGGGGNGALGVSYRPGAPSQAPTAITNYGSSMPARF